MILAVFINKYLPNSSKATAHNARMPLSGSNITFENITIMYIHADIKNRVWHLGIFCRIRCISRWRYQTIEYCHIIVFFFSDGCYLTIMYNEEKQMVKMATMNFSVYFSVPMQRCARQIVSLAPIICRVRNL